MPQYTHHVTSTCSLSSYALEQMKDGESILDFFKRYESENPNVSSDTRAIRLAVPYETRGVMVTEPPKYQERSNSVTLGDGTVISILSDPKRLQNTVERLNRYHDQLGAPSFDDCGGRNKLFLLSPSPLWWDDVLPLHEETTTKVTVVDTEGNETTVSTEMDVPGVSTVVIAPQEGEEPTVVTVESTDDGSVEVTVQESEHKEEHKKNFFGL